MKTLITTLNSQYIHSNLAVRYLYSAAAGDGRNVHLREFTINNEDSYIYGEILKGDYDMVAFSCYIWNVEKTIYLAENLKKAAPHMQILLGGPEVSHDALDLLMENRFVDYIIQGEGEQSLRKLLDVLETEDGSGEGLGTDEVHQKKGAELAGVDGLIYRFDGKVFINQAAEPAKMDMLSFPYRYIAPENDKILYYESSRGCPFNCAYCLSSLERRVRSLSMDRIFEDLRYFLLKEVKQVKFIDRTFNFDRKRALEIFKYLIENDNGVTNFHMEICADLIDNDTLQLLRTARKGLFQFEIGVQSTNREALFAVNRSADVVSVLDNICNVVALGNIEVHADLIAGLPFEDYDSFAHSFNNVYMTKAHKIHLGFLKLLKGTAIRKSAEKYGYAYRSKPPYEVISNSFISAKDLVRLHQVEHVLDLYYNRGGFEKTLYYFTTEVAASPFAFYEELADYYYLKGYQHASHKKEDLYRILDAFAVYKDRRAKGCGPYIHGLLEEDLRANMNPEAVKKFEKKGWEI